MITLFNPLNHVFKNSVHTTQKTKSVSVTKLGHLMTLWKIIIIIIMFLDIHRPVFNFKHTMFRRLDSVSVFKWNPLSWAQSVQLVPISGYWFHLKTETESSLRNVACFN
jgi:hypothetical protein